MAGFAEGAFFVHLNLRWATIMGTSRGTKAGWSGRKRHSGRKTSGPCVCDYRWTVGYELALFNLGIDSKLRGCDLVGIKVRDVCHGNRVAARATVIQLKTKHPVQFEITLAAREAVQAWIKLARLRPEDFLFPSRLQDSPHLGARQYARILGHG